MSDGSKERATEMTKLNQTAIKHAILQRHIRFPDSVAATIRFYGNEASRDRVTC